jgi:hypothetical protein
MEGDGSCINPSPLRDPSTLEHWIIFDGTFHATTYIGDNWVPTGRLITEMKACAEAHGIPWDHVALRGTQTIIDEWLKREWKKKRKSSKKKRGDDGFEDVADEDDDDYEE